MSVRYRSLKGMKDLLPPESFLWAAIQSKARALFESFGFSEISTPLVEYAELFTRHVGPTTDIVEKQMYIFKDKKGDSIALRPEGTAPIVRAYLEHQLYHPDPYQKFYYWGPMYRYERMQKGRYRQHTQLGVEVFGATHPRIDAETIALLAQFYRVVGIEAFEVQINSMGCRECRPKFLKKLLDDLKPKKAELCHDCQRRLEKNPMRVLDCKEEGCQQRVKGAPRILEHLCRDCEGHFEGLKEALHQLNVVYTINPFVVRGLDYYVKTAFEIVSSALGAQSSLGGGGRYDGLVKSLGGADIPGFGFGAGIERLVLALPDAGKTGIRTDLFVAALGSKAQAFSYALVNKFRTRGVRTEVDYENRPLKAQMKKADRLGARYVLMMGDEEMDKGEALLRNMDTKEQKSIPMGDLLKRIKKEMDS